MLTKSKAAARQGSSWAIPHDQGDTEGLACLGEHPPARIQPHHDARGAGDAHRSTGDGTRAHGHVQDLHPSHEPGTAQRMPAVPRARPEGHGADDPVVERGGLIEDAGQVGLM